jgi:hypothetical protein
VPLGARHNVDPNEAATVVAARQIVGRRAMFVEEASGHTAGQNRSCPFGQGGEPVEGGLQFLGCRRPGARDSLLVC